MQSTDWSYKLEENGVKITKLLYLTLTEYDNIELMITVLLARFLILIKKVFHVSVPNLLCMLLVTSSRTSSIMAEKIKMADLLRFFAFYVNNLTLWTRYPSQICYACY